MKVLCQFFPEAEALNMEEEYYEEEAVSKLKLINSSTSKLASCQGETGMDTLDESIYWPTETTERPQIKINATNDSSYLYSTQTDRFGSRTPTPGQFLMPATTPVDARWASGDSSGNPKIVSSQGANNAPTVRGDSALLSSMQPLNLEIDPNAWELKNHDLHQFLGNACEY